jgi:hypothetical protein
MSFQNLLKTQQNDVDIEKEITKKEDLVKDINNGES